MSEKLVKQFEINGTVCELDTSDIQEQIDDVGYFTSDDDYIRLIVDSEQRILFGIKQDGSVDWSKGIPDHVKTYIQDSVNQIDSSETIIRINESLDELMTNISNVDSRVSEIETIHNTTESDDYVSVITDSEDKLLEAIKTDGTKWFPKQTLLDIKNNDDYLELTLDASDKIVSYRDLNGVKFENKMIIENGLNLGQSALSDLKKSLIASGFNIKTPVDWSSETTITLPIPRYCAKVNIISSTGLATTKTQNKKCTLQYYDKSGNYFEKYIILNAQGSSSMSYVEKNQSIDVYNDEACEESCDIIFGNWVPQDSFHFKCYYIDVFRGISNVCYNLCEEAIQFTNSRNNRIVLDNSATTSSNSTGDFDVDFGDSALCHPDGFPFEMYVNGEYYGLYAWNLKKHRKNYSMNKKDYSAVLLDGVIDQTTLFNGTVQWNQFELRNPKELVNMSGAEYDGETPTELIDETSEVYDANNEVHVKTAQTKKLVERQAGAIALIKAESDNSAARTLYEQYYDVNAMMCYLIMGNLTYHYDGFRKNWIWCLYNNIMAPSFYDMDSVFGRHWNGTTVVSGSNSGSLTGVSESLPTGLCYKLYKDEVHSMYADLRKSGIISVKNVMKHVYDWMNRVGRIEYEKNLEKWPSIPSYRSEKNMNDGTSEGGFFDSAKRVEMWVSEKIKNLDTTFQYSEEN